jgi:hypothetical protein
VWREGKGFEITHDNKTRLEIREVTIRDNSVLIDVVDLPVDGQVKVWLML